MHLGIPSNEAAIPSLASLAYLLFHTSLEFFVLLEEEREPPTDFKIRATATFS